MSPEQGLVDDLLGNLHDVRVSSTVIYERQGDLEAAIEEYRTALRYAPSYEPARQALLRLAGIADAGAPRSAAEDRAALSS